MTEKEIKKLHKKFADGTLSSKEEKILEAFNAKLLKLHSTNVNLKDKHKTTTKSQIAYHASKHHYKKRIASRISTVAAVVLFVSAVGYFTIPSLIPKNPSPEVSFLTKETLWGQKMNITLADGTTVRLNSGSTLKFPDKFIGKTRTVSLVGEAFFDVAKNKKKPFVIKTETMETTVLGTSFNIKAYTEQEDIEVAVLTGKVKVAANNTSLLLNPYEQSIFNKNSTVFTKNSIAKTQFPNWKDGTLSFDDESLLNVAQALEKWYGITILFDNEALKACHLTATYENEKLKAVLKSLMFTKKDMDYSFIDEKTIILKGTCNDN